MRGADHRLNEQTSKEYSIFSHTRCSNEFLCTPHCNSDLIASFLLERERKNKRCVRSPTIVHSIRPPNALTVTRRPQPPSSNDLLYAFIAVVDHQSSSFARMRRQAYALWVGRLRLPLHESTRRAESAFDRERIASAFYIETEGRGMYVKQAKEMIHTACKTWAWSSILQTDSPASRGGVSLVSTTATPSSAERATTRDQHQAVNQANEETVSEAYASRPRPLDFIRTARPSPIDRPGFLRRALLVIGGYYSKESTVMRAAENLYNCVKEQATNQRMFTVMEVPRNKFQQQYSLLCLHVWLLIVRLRAEGPDGKRISQRLYEDFQADVEDRVRAFGVRVRVSKQLEELEKQFFGSAVAYDRCLRGESGESLSDALFRNIYLQDPEKKRAAKKLERYVRREMACLAITSSEAVTAGNIKFSSI